MRIPKGIESVQKAPSRGTESVQETPPKRIESMQSASPHNTESHLFLYLKEILTQKPKENWKGFNSQIKA